MPTPTAPALTRDQWAWEFLRRNPEYQADYRQFITLLAGARSRLRRAAASRLCALEAGPACLWSAGPRRCRALDNVSGDLCVGEDDRVFIECWMGAKWGFHKFPLDPERATPPDSRRTLLAPATCSRTPARRRCLTGWISRLTCRCRCRRNSKLRSFAWSAVRAELRRARAGGTDDAWPTSARAGRTCCACSMPWLRVKR